MSFANISTERPKLVFFLELPNILEAIASSEERVVERGSSGSGWAAILLVGVADWIRCSCVAVGAVARR